MLTYPNEACNDDEHAVLIAILLHGKSHYFCSLAAGVLVLGVLKDFTRMRPELVLSPVESAMPVTAASMPENATPVGNRLLASLPPEDGARLSKYLKTISLRRRHALLRQGQPVPEIVFPTGGVCSLVKTTEEGHTIEIMGIGAEGAIGAAVAFGQAESPTDVLVQVPSDGAMTLALDVFKAEMQQRGTFYAAMTQYCRILTEQLMQACACNALHSAEKRCCRWLLTTDDRVQSESFAVTQEMLAMTLGVRRPTVTLIMTDLHRAGAVDYSRGIVKVLDRKVLLAGACECYRALSPAFTTAG
jgi:CRP-like cAMP-binding protein